MTSIDFYFNAPDKLTVACRLAGKALAQKKRLLIYAPEPETAQRVDRMLWTWPATGFVPHCLAHDPLAVQTPVLIASDEELPQPCEIMLNLSPETPPHFERFDRLLEIVAHEEEERKSGRARYRWYRDRGYPIGNYDLAQGSSAQ